MQVLLSVEDANTVNLDRSVHNDIVYSQYCNIFVHITCTVLYCACFIGGSYR